MKSDVVFALCAGALSCKIIKTSKIVRSILINELQAKKYDVIGIVFDHCPQIIPVILSILNTECSFSPISISSTEDKIINSMKNYEAKFLISTKMLNKTFENKLKLRKSFLLLNSMIYFYVNKRKTTPLEYHFCYIIETSGSTSTPKIVKVPYDCIIPNVDGLSEIYNLTSMDVIFPFAPPTFDPFILDVLLAFKYGAALFMTSKHLRFNSKKLVEIINPISLDKNIEGVTIIQMTPSILKLLSSEFVNKIICNGDSSLRILILGGETFPLNEIKEWNVWNFSKRKRIFNIYGITEVSCWSTIQEITKDTNEVLLGNPIDKNTVINIRLFSKTEFFIDNDNDYNCGEILIGSKIRKCLINNEDLHKIQNNDLLYRLTGDVGTKVKENNIEKIYLKGRTNEIIKRYGLRVNLKKIENIVEEEYKNFLMQAYCIFCQNNNQLILFINYKFNENYTNLKETDIKLNLKNKLCHYEFPDNIIFIDKFPITYHGKVSKNKLLEIYIEKSENDGCENNINYEEIFLSWIVELLQLKTKNNAIYSSSFINLGGNSFQALNLIMKLEILTQQSHPDILEMLLKSDCNLREIFSKCKKILSYKSELISEGEFSKIKFNMKIKWKHNFKKCIDANPTLLDTSENSILISVGSHSHLLLNINAKTGVNNSCIILPDRIEGQVSIVKVSNTKINYYGLIGCYDGHLYKFNVLTGEIIWKYDSCGIIKCRPLIFGEYVIFGNYYDLKNIYNINLENGTDYWSIKFGDKGISSSPVQIDNNTFIITTLNGTFGRIEIKTGNILWQFKLDSPIFSTCSLLTENCFILSEVNGLVHCFDLLGSELWKFKAGGTIFSSFEIFNNSNCCNIFFGCHDFNIYCLQYNEDERLKIQLKWKTHLQSQIYSTPKIININNQNWIVVCSTSGFINIINIENGNLLSNLQLNGEIFSTPAIYENYIFIGCRDNYLYSIGIKE